MISKRFFFQFVYMLLLIVLFLPVCAITVNASEITEQKKVRIGYMIYEGYQNGGEGEPKSGSAYEYYQKIKCYTDWEYEYVYGSLSEMLEMLEKGEIDIVSCITYSDERAKKYLFSEESHGLESYFLYTHSDDDEITPADLSSLNGKKVGVTLDSYQERYFSDWCETEGISCDIVTYKYIDELRVALTNKEVDAIVDVSIVADDEERTPWKSIYRFTSEPLYFAVSKKRPDILQELNDAQAYIVSIDEYYGYETMKKYHDGINYHNAYLTPRQQKYIENNRVMKVGYLEGTNPLSFTDSKTGEMSGLCAEYLEVMRNAYGIEFETYMYQDENLMIEDLLSGKVDVIFPLGMGYWVAEELGVSLSTSICNLPMSAIYLEIGESDTFEKIAVNENSPTQVGYATQHYPDAEIYYVENTREALEAVKDRNADVYFVRSSSLEYMNQKFQIYNQFRTMSVRNDMEAFMATRMEDTTLSIILDKGISLLTDTERDSARFRYSYTVEKVSLWQAIKDNMEIVVGIFVILILLCVVLVFIVRSQSDKEHMKMLMAESEKAKKAEQAKTEFLSQMSHDIRTPMNAIIGFTNFIKEEEDIEKIKQDYIPKIELSSNHLLMLINDVLEMSKIETGKLVFNREIYDIYAIVENVLGVIRGQAEDKRLHLITEFDVTERVVKCDKNHLSRVIINLLSNAVKFTPEEGTISISVRQQPNAPKGYVTYEIQVSDNGIGMEPEFLERIFEPFERERTSTISGMQGTGLGMAIVKRIVDTAEDTITVESTPGEGSIFTLNTTLILADAEPEEILDIDNELEKQYSPEQLKNQFEGKRILLVEDNEFNSTIATAILENAGFMVETAENGKIAVQKVMDAPSSEYYNLILMDIQMPIMNGYEATKQIRTLDDARSEVKIIAVTANAFEIDKENAKNAGMNGHVSKPLDIDNLYQVLIEVTETCEDSK